LVKVSLISYSSEDPADLISHAARTCYSVDVPKMGDKLDIENQLFKTGHHTTLQHNYFTFNIDGLSVSSATFGLHLCHPFYNTDQRSGRYSKMYKNPDFEEIRTNILNYYPNCNIEEVINFLKIGRQIYKDNMKNAEKIALQFIKKDRPFLAKKNIKDIETLANKIAQEQMRVFLSTIFPTALDYTINLSTIVTMYYSAWSPELRDITKQMKDIILDKYPNLSYMFKEQRETNWYLKSNIKDCGVCEEPKLNDLNITFPQKMKYNFISKTENNINTKCFSPENLNNNFFLIESDIEVSIATMAQDQRHRTLKRSEPVLTGNFYLPPILGILNLKEKAIEYMKEYIKLYNNIDKNLALSIIPYGAMVNYRKYGDVNAIIHEQEKRLCWATQEEIYNLSRQLHEKLSEKKNCEEIANQMCPSCYKGGCTEGGRYCGRDTSKIEKTVYGKTFIPIRKI
jgi:thymidylate synthase ThyX